MPARDTSSGMLNKMCASLRPYIKELWKDMNFGLCRSKVDIEKLKYSSSDRNYLADQFTLVLPYAGSHLRWEVMFDAARPSFAPDFRFDDETFMSNVSAESIEKSVPSLAKWDVDNPKALSNVIAELMNMYRDHQKMLLCEDENSRACFEYTALIGDSLTLENDVEILVGRGESVNFMIKLNIDDLLLPALFPGDVNENRGGECAVILVKYPNPAKADLIMSPLVMRAVGNIELPPMHPTGVLMDYVPTVTDIINKKIMTVLQNEKLRQQVISRLIVKYEGCVLEHDSNKASFLIELDNFYCILHIEIGVDYPENPPTFTLRSIYHSHEGRPRFKTLTKFQYENIEEYVAKEFEIFRLECTATTIDDNKPEL